MASIHSKSISEKQRLKLEKFANKKEKQSQQAQSNGPLKEKRSNKAGAATVRSEDWLNETPAGEKKILKPLEDEFHKAYIPKVVESAWYSFWESQGLFQPRTENDGRLTENGKYVIAIPPPNVSPVCSCN